MEKRRIEGIAGSGSICDGNLKAGNMYILLRCKALAAIGAKGYSDDLYTA